MTRRRSIVKTTVPTATIRCAIYSRKSSEEGLAQEFNSLDAQRDAAEAYIASQKAEGWVALPDRYDDGGYTGGNMERPALRRLLADIDAGKVDCVIVYKVDRLSRSLMDFARIMETFDRHKVSFVSVTQHFNTTHSMGRLTLNILLSFAQFEREIIGERIRDKVAASRQRGKWTGGTPILGYDVDRSNVSPKLVINPKEASQVQQIFTLYLELGSLLPVVHEMRRRDWRCKTWITRKGKAKGGFPLDKTRLHDLLTNVLYAGRITYKDKVFAGEHGPIISEDIFSRVQMQLKKNGRSGTVEFRNKHGALLRGLLHCNKCHAAMTHTFTNRGNKRYRYYTCASVMKNGRGRCSTPSLPAGEIDKAVVDEIRCIGQDPGLVAETLRQARQHAEAEITRLTHERQVLERSLGRCHAEIRKAATARATEGDTATRIAELDGQVSQAEARLKAIACEITELQRDLVTDADVKAGLGDFDNVWKALSPREQAHVIQLLIKRVNFDAAESTIEVAFHPSGIKALATEAEDKRSEAATAETGRPAKGGAKQRRGKETTEAVDAAEAAA